MSDTKKEGREPETPRPASTVILVRRHGDGLQVYLLKRNPESGFFPGNYVFPGGAVSPPDRDALFRGARSDLPVGGFSNRFGAAPGEAEILPFFVSAIRETFEEAGVFLGGPFAGGWLEGVCRLRTTNGLSREWLREAAGSGSCTLGISMLAPWSHWITPQAMGRRFDTRFFVAFMPPGQTCSPDCRETVEGIWARPGEALAGNLKGIIPLSPPTVVTLHQLLPYEHVGELQAALAVRSWGDPVLPRLVQLPRGVLIVEPWDPMYERESGFGEYLEDDVLPVGEPFSRIWFHRGLWRPVRVEDR